MDELVSGLCPPASRSQGYSLVLCWFSVLMWHSPLFLGWASPKQKEQNIMTNRQLMLPLPCHSGPPAAISGHASCKSSQWNTCPQCNLLACRSFHFFALKEINILRHQMSAVQILALLSGLAGLGATIGATVSNEWRATSRASSVITATWVLQGLWNNCAGNAIGAVHCRPHHTILQLQGKQARVK